MSDTPVHPAQLPAGVRACLFDLDGVLTDDSRAAELREHGADVVVRDVSEVQLPEPVTTGRCRS